MANCLENLGLNFLMEDDTIMNFVGLVVKDGKPIPNYHQLPHFFTPMGACEFWAGTEILEDGHCSVNSLDSHCCGKSTWNMVSTGIDVSPKDLHPMKRRILLRKKDGGGMLPVEIINADVLPSLLEDEQVKLQMVAFPTDIHYYADDEAYATAQPEDDFGKKWMIGEGALFPSGFLKNHAVGRPEEEQDDELDLLVSFNAKVNSVTWGVVELGGQQMRSFLYCNADTEYGALDFVHAIEQVPEEERPMMKEGSVISGICVLSGDAVIFEYENGIVLDHEHDLHLLRDCIVRGDEGRLRAILTEDAEYMADGSSDGIKGVDKIITVLQKYRSEKEGRIYTYLGEICAVADLEEKIKPEGTRCIVVAEDEKENYVAVVFVDVDGEGKIKSIRWTADGRYQFRLDQPEKPESILKDIVIPENPVEPILARAKLHGLVDDTIEKDQLLEEDSDYYNHRKNADRMIQALRDHPQSNVETALENLFGYLFAKAIEQTRNENRPMGDGSTRLAASYNPADALAGDFHSTLEPKEHEKLLKALELGKEFFNDFRFFVESNQLPEEKFDDRLAIALAAVQRIGQIFTAKFLPDDPQR